MLRPKTLTSDCQLSQPAQNIDPCGSRPLTTRRDPDHQAQIAAVPVHFVGIEPSLSILAAWLSAPSPGHG